MALFVDKEEEEEEEDGADLPRVTMFVSKLLLLFSLISEDTSLVKGN